MIPFSCSLGNGRIVAGQDDFVIVPRSGTRNRRAIVLLHGQLQATSAWLAPSTPGQFGILQALAAAGFVCLGGYYEGPAWGNATAIADIEAFRTYAGTLGAKNDKLLLLGASMGNYDAIMYAAAHPDRVAGIASVLPACDINDARDNNRGGNTQANINTAWGMPAGSTSGTNPLPTAAVAMASVNVTAVASSGPIRYYYSTADTTVLPSTVTAYRDAVNAVTPGKATATVTSSTLDHGDAAMGTMPMTEVAQFFDQLAS